MKPVLVSLTVAASVLAVAAILQGQAQQPVEAAYDAGTVTLGPLLLLQHQHGGENKVIVLDKQLDEITG